MENIRILFLAADPRSKDRLGLDDEARAIDRKIREAGSREMKLITEWAVRPDDIMLYLNRHRPHVVHFSGHGSEAEELVFVGDGAVAKPLPKEAIDLLFCTFKDNIQLVVFNACFAEIQAEAVVKHIDCVIGMSGVLHNGPAIAFAAAFYRALGFGRSVKEAVQQGKLAPIMGGRKPVKPRLLTADGVDPEKVYLIPHYQIVLVEHNSLVVDCLKKPLQDSGHTVHTITMVIGPEELRREIEGIKPDAVILDYNFHDLKIGSSFIESLKSSAPHRPILFYTGFPNLREIIKVTGIPSSDIFNKTNAVSDSERLVGRIGEHLCRSQQRKN